MKIFGYSSVYFIKSNFEYRLYQYIEYMYISEGYI
jgi:hypothetical protein